MLMERNAVPNSLKILSNTINSYICKVLLNKVWGLEGCGVKLDWSYKCLHCDWNSQIL